MRHFLISCGGTGGHLAPGIALAEGLIARGHAATLLVSGKKIDARLAAKYPALRFEAVPAAPFAGGPAGWARGAWALLRGTAFCRRLVRKTRPAAVVAFGGFTAAPAALAARLAGVPVALHEANRVPGRATRVLARLARRIYLPPGVELPDVDVGVRRHAALPVRAEIARVPRAAACARFGLDPSKLILAVLGGSQGASPLNDWARHELPALAAAGVQLCCVTGPGKAGAAGGEAAGAAVFMEFCDDMAALLSAADLAVSRAGAGTIAELIRVGTPAILVPYPHAADNHQQANADWFSSEGGGLVLSQSNLASLGVRARDLLADPARRSRHREALRALDRPAALGLMLDDLENLHQPPPAPMAMQFTLA
jgi:UDP-N-acetylglucosamine--N-acetylmuramyl-(pentapeptide) pyrophosphoryl-undecaprenol N-acetylglucosamine transferase